MHCWARYLLIAVVTLLAFASMVGACGRKGPLYLPPESSEPAPPAASDVPAVPPERSGRP